MVEESPYLRTLKKLSIYTKRNPRVCFIGEKLLSIEKEAHHAKALIGLRDEDIKLVSSFEEWKDAYLALQERVDVVLVVSCDGIEQWDAKLAEAFIMEHTVKPSGAVADVDVRLALLGVVKIAEEQGWWAGQTALRILEGTAPAAIPVVSNQCSKRYLNMKLAKRMGIRFPAKWIRRATLVEE